MFAIAMASILTVLCIQQQRRYWIVNNVSLCGLTHRWLQKVVRQANQFDVPAGIQI
jgi:hypothetical protein